MRIAVYRLRNQHDAEDAVMNAMLTMHSKIDRILGASNPIALATKILNDTITDYCRSSVRIARNEQPVAEMPTVSYLMDLGRHDPLDRAMEELEVVAPLQARCVQLHHLIGLSYDQVAKIADISVTAAKTNAHRGRRHLGRMLEELPKEKGDS
ncbi:RNA polymerase sigma factor [Streptomyces sp. NPDC018007]|uniref:RNA polymerase sigma factor n=1 Tax=Streptomyces sp. NPDC018007 TaxID=3365029 RepID=UPI0037A5DBE0